MAEISEKNVAKKLEGLSVSTRLDQLPDEVLQRVFNFVSKKDRLGLYQVNRKFRDLIRKRPHKLRIHYEDTYEGHWHYADRKLWHVEALEILRRGQYNIDSISIMRMDEKNSRHIWRSSRDIYKMPGDKMLECGTLTFDDCCLTLEFIHFIIENIFKSNIEMLLISSCHFLPSKGIETEASLRERIFRLVNQPAIVDLVHTPGAMNVSEFMDSCFENKECKMFVITRTRDHKHFEDIRGPIAEFVSQRDEKVHLWLTKDLKPSIENDKQRIIKICRSLPAAGLFCWFIRTPNDPGKYILKILHCEDVAKQEYKDLVARDFKPPIGCWNSGKYVLGGVDKLGQLQPIQR